MVTTVDYFAFNRGGSLRITATIPDETRAHDGSIKAYVCTDVQFSGITHDTLTTDAECLGQSRVTCEASAVLNSSVPHDFSISRVGRYRIALLNCGESIRNGVVVKYEAVNPGGDQLPYGDGRLPLVYHALFASWLAFFGYSVYSFLLARDRRNLVHVALVGVILLKTLVVFLSAWYWQLYRSGRRVDALSYARKVTFASSEAAFFAAFLVVSKGWRITRMHMRSSELKTLLLALCGLLVALSFFSFYSNDYYFLSLMIMYFFLLPKIFSGITKNVRSLENQIWMAENVQLPRESLNAFQHKLQVFRFLRGSVIAYLGTILLINSLRIVVLWYWDWINVLINEAVSFLIIAFVSVALKPGRGGVFTDLAEIAQLATLQTLIDRSAAMANPDAPRIAPWNVRATLVLKYPSKFAANNCPDTMSSEPAAHNICLAIQEDYDKSEKFEASTHRPATAS